MTAGSTNVIISERKWRQFRFSIGAPDAEAKFKKAVADAQNWDLNAIDYPSLYVRYTVVFYFYRD